MWYFWPENYMWSYQVSRILGHSVYGGSQFSECLQAASPAPLLKIEIYQLFKTLQKRNRNKLQEMEVIVVGRIPEEVETFASKVPMGAIKWWPMEAADSLETCIQYAKFCALCTEKIVVLP